MDIFRNHVAHYSNRVRKLTDRMTEYKIGHRRRNRKLRCPGCVQPIVALDNRPEIILIPAACTDLQISSILGPETLS